MPLIMENNTQFLRIPLKVENATVQREFVLGEPVGAEGLVVVRNIPALAYNVAYGDLIESIDEVYGNFRVIKRSGNITLRAFVQGPLDTPEIVQLIDQVVSLAGLYEVGKNDKSECGRSLLLLSLSIDVGLEKIEQLMSCVTLGGGEWEYGNVYDEKGEVLGWWD